MSGSTAEKSDFIGGMRWHVPQPDPSTSECCELVLAARQGDKAALTRCEGLFENFKPRPKARKPAPKPVRKPAPKRKLKRS